MASGPGGLESRFAADELLVEHFARKLTAAAGLPAFVL
jgi:hypothetical protein